MITIEVTRQIDDFMREVWEFWLDTSTIKADLIFNSYEHQARETMKKKYVTLRHYRRTSQRDNTMLLEDVPFTKDVAQEAKDKLVKTITIQTKLS